MEHVLAEVSYVISVAIERQSKAPGGIDAAAYALLRNAQKKLGGAAGMVAGESPSTGQVEVPHETPVASSGCSVCGGSGVRCCEFGAAGVAA
jgi:hypothetical protein